MFGFYKKTRNGSDECPRYDTKLFDDEVWGMRFRPSLPLLPGPLWPGMVAPDRVLSMSQKELFDI